MIMILTFLLSAGLFAAGGTEIKTTGRGYKWMRRFVLPIGMGIIAAFNSTWWQAIIYAVALCSVLHLGYGDRCNWIKRIGIFVGYGAVSLVFGWSWWVVATPTVLSLLFLASRWKPLSTTVFWKSWETIAGLLIALCFVGAMLNKWQI
jgi:hypothetical protein